MRSFELEEGSSDGEGSLGCVPHMKSDLGGFHREAGRAFFAIVASDGVSILLLILLLCVLF